MRLLQTRGWLIGAVTILLLSACGGSSDTASTDTAGTAGLPARVSLSGTVTYDRVPVTTSGLDYPSTYVQPVRGAVVNLLDSTDQVLASTVTSDTGYYQFTVEVDTLVKVQVEARSQQTGTPSWHLRVEDNTSDNALYVLEGALASTGAGDSTRNLHAASGWTGSGYGEPRAAAPFAILDTAYTIVQKLLTLDEALALPVSVFRWSPLNNTATGSLDSGDIGTSFYSSAAVYLLGDENNDTDEYDQHVIAHEWGHYLEASVVQRTDSIGGSHSSDEKLDMRVAFSEGFSNALSAYLLDDPLYLDSLSYRQAASGGFDVSAGSLQNKGWFNESSVHYVLYQLSQTPAGDAALYKVLTDDSYRNADAHLSIFTFAERLKALAPESFALFEPFYSAESIHSSSAYGTDESNDGDTPGTLPVYKSLPADGTRVNVCSTQINGAMSGSNKLGSWVYLKAQPLFSGLYQLSVVKTSPPLRITDPDFVVTRRGLSIAEGYSMDADAESATFSLAAGDTYIISVQDWARHEISQTPSCFDLTLAPVL